MSEELARLREVLGRSASLWATDGVTFEPWGWTAFSGTRSVDYNVVLCRDGGDAVDVAVERIAAAGVPAVLMLCGPGLAEAQRLVARSWVCIGATPVMTQALTVTAGDLDPQARRLQGDAELAGARALVSRVFEVDEALAAVALGAPGGDHEVWGAFDDGELRSCLALVRVQQAAVVWSMATEPATRGRGLGRRVLRSALEQAARDGAREAVLYSSEPGEPFYRRLGLVERDRWQIWSRPRWVLGRA